MLELLADPLRDNPPPESRANYEFRKYAERVMFALNLISIEMTSRPRVVAMRNIDRRSTALTRQAAQRAWSKRLDKTGDQVAALEAAVRETLAREPTWSFNDAIRHAVALVMPCRSAFGLQDTPSARYSARFRCFNAMIKSKF